MVRDIKIVTGASYGDEGKGLMTDYFCGKADKPCITVLHNGGSQRGHTVISKDGLRHVFHHLGSGTFACSDTYFADSFIINPLVFAEEYREINPVTKIYCSPKCMWSTPFDMMTNQIIEDSRGDNRHGSCGYGIWETIVRYNNSYTISFPDFMAMKNADKVKYLEDIRDRYMSERLREVGINDIPSEWEDIVYSDGIIGHFIDDCNYFNNIVGYSEDIPEKYEYIVFEGAQGLLLSQSEENPHTTPSFTGAENPVRIINTLGGVNNIEVCYITRTYLTRHGNGSFPQECTKAEINPDMIDKTNVPNNWQGTLRYGRIDTDELRQRIYADFDKFREFENAKISLAVTHMDETHGKLITVDGEENPNPGFIGINKIYYSYSEKKSFGI
ncbi:MAG: adenylosuccinate synthetase [Ruminococcus flavefaciens]|nr:adenylosuccinate synthetase [Ruminococcus flavefaciens]MCM1229859.1 adenylosuccinate synthetase [Ruminococcus flavefaciens]